MLKQITSPEQSAFVPGRLITDNALVAFEVFHSMKRRGEGKDDTVALKLDMMKAYDQVEWEFLEKAMHKLGFCDEWTQKIMGCLSCFSFSFKLNREIIGKVVSHRGLRQGDPISPYLFLLVADAFSRLLLKASRKNIIHGAKSKSYGVLKNCGFSVFMKELQGKKLILANQRQHLVRLSQWIDEKAYVNLLESRRTPDGLIDEIPSIFARFLVGQCGENKMHWKSWDTLCLPKSKGGMGFRNLTVFNQSLLAKGWRLMQCGDTLLHRVLKAKYFKHSDFLEARRGFDPSYTWLWGAKSLLLEGLHWRVGNGRDV
ncbi:uncharacterized protein LOC110684901 [Chenopodium quinoa]|uniref:uncharacterized protein LOC110684901 n=1 Tax=Chenopodium quinoa TaxID=63459 RepID=UPI000B795745|nr:uncharacterized protein LOC110684901 [Chenopodium quinoa]